MVSIVVKIINSHDPVFFFTATASLFITSYVSYTSYRFPQLTHKMMWYDQNFTIFQMKSGMFRN
jgi:hypothetical protein